MGVGSDGVFWDDPARDKVAVVDVAECMDHEHILVAEHST